MKNLKFLLVAIVAMFAVVVNVNAIDNETALSNCLTGTDATCTLTGNVTLNSAVTIANDKEIDLGSYTLTTTKTITINADVVIKGTGSIYAASGVDPMIKVVEFASLDVQGGTLFNESKFSDVIKLEGSKTDTTNKTEVTIGANATLKGNYGISISNGGNNYGAVVNFAGLFEGITGNNSYNEGTIGINLNGNNKATSGNVPVINIKGGSITTAAGTSGNANDDSAPAIYAAGYGIWNISGGELTGTEALGIKSGVFNITGGVFNATGEYVEPPVANGDGSVATGSAVSITANDGYASEVELTVDGGTFESKNAFALYEGDTTVGSDAVKTIAINDGEFVGKEGSVYSKNETGFVSGGTFNLDVEEELVADGLITTKDTNGNYVIGTPASSNAGNSTNVKNPDTSDGVFGYIALALISVLAISSCVVLKKRFN